MKKILAILALALFTTGTITSCSDEEVVPTENYSGVNEDTTPGGV